MNLKIESMATRMIAIADVGSFTANGWIVTRSLGKDVMVAKPERDLTDDEREAQGKPFRGG